MKISRQKKIHKTLNFFLNNYGFYKPFQILIDGTYAYAALKNQHNIEEMLPKYFQSELKLLTTQCIILETENLSKKLIGTMIIIKKFGTHKCIHGIKPVAGAECIKTMIGEKNSSRYIVATQDRDLQNYLRNIPGVPLLYLHNRTPVLEQPSKITLDTAKNNIEKRFQITSDEDKVLGQLKKENNVITNLNKVPRKKHKGGPNPLSCKKKTKICQSINSTKVEKNNKKNKKRKRVRVPQHVKEELFKNMSQ